MTMSYSVASWAQGWLAPVYDKLGQAIPFIVAVALIFILYRQGWKISKRVKAKKSIKKDVGSTNDWFSWNKYEEWKSEREKGQSSK